MADNPNLPHTLVPREGIVQKLPSAAILDKTFSLFVRLCNSSAEKYRLIKSAKEGVITLRENKEFKSKFNNWTGRLDANKALTLDDVKGKCKDSGTIKTIDNVKSSLETAAGWISGQENANSQIKLMTEMKAELKAFSDYWVVTSSSFAKEYANEEKRIVDRFKEPKDSGAKWLLSGGGAQPYQYTGLAAKRIDALEPALASQGKILSGLVNNAFTFDGYLGALDSIQAKKADEEKIIGRLDGVQGASSNSVAGYLSEIKADYAEQLRLEAQLIYAKRYYQEYCSEVSEINGVLMADPHYGQEETIRYRQGLPKPELWAAIDSWHKTLGERLAVVERVLKRFTDIRTRLNITGDLDAEIQEFFDKVKNEKEQIADWQKDCQEIRRMMDEFMGLSAEPSKNKTRLVELFWELRTLIYNQDNYGNKITKRRYDGMGLATLARPRNIQLDYIGRWQVWPLDKSQHYFQIYSNVQPIELLKLLEGERVYFKNDTGKFSDALPAFEMRRDKGGIVAVGFSSEKWPMFQCAMQSFYIYSTLTDGDRRYIHVPKDSVTLYAGKDANISGVETRKEYNSIINRMRKAGWDIVASD